MRTRTLSAALGAAALVLTAGCSSSSDIAGDPAEPTAAASSAAADGGTGLTPANFAQTLGTAQQDATSSHVELSMEMGGQAIEGSGDVEIAENPDDVEMQMSMAAGGQDIELVFSEGLVYIKVAAMTGDKWIKADPEDAAAQQLTGSFGQMREQMDPAKSLELLDGAITDVTDTGETEQIDGVEATRYDVSVDTKKLGASELPQGVPAQLTYSYWLGPDDLPRKVAFDLAGATAEIIYTDWGKPVDVEAPASKDTVDLKDVAGLSGLSG